VVWFVDCELNGCGNPPKKILQDERLKQVLSGVQFREARIIEGPPPTSLKILPGRGVYKETRQNFEGKGFTGKSHETKDLWLGDRSWCRLRLGHHLFTGRALASSDVTRRLCKA
jgi:hypothetical protein